MVREIPLSRGLVAFIDDEDFATVSQFKWYADRCGWTDYARRGTRIDGKKSSVLMHRQILVAVPGEIVDHIDGNGLNNTRGNLRKASASENGRNLPRGRRNNTSGFLGVTWNKKDRTWVAQIKFDGKVHRFSPFATSEDAALFRDQQAIKHHGNFATLNFPVRLIDQEAV